MLSTSWRKVGSRRLRGCGSSTLISAATRPGLDENTRMRSHISTASSMLCVTISTDLIGSRPSIHRTIRSVRSVSAVNTSSAESALDVLTAETLRTDLIDLWIEGRLPIKSVLMVTHNIEEAVLMCDRILVFSSNPGRVAAELKVELPHPRNRLDPAFRQLVDSIYARMTQRAEVRSPAIEGIHGTGVGMILNHVSSNVLSGLIETLAGPPYSGHADLPILAGHLQLEADEIFHLGEALQLLRFAQLSEGDLMLTDAGKRFAHLETDARKKLFAEHLLSYVPVMGLIQRVLDERPSHTAPAARFRNELEDYMSEDYADETLKTIVSWGRYAELFAYDEQSETFSLENPH